MNTSALKIVLGLFTMAAAGMPLAAMPASESDAAMSMETLRQQIKTDQRALMERSLGLTATEAEKFWPIYGRYHHDLDHIIRRQNRVILEYVQAEPSMTDANAKRMAIEMLAADGEEQRLYEKQLRKALAVLPGKKAARYIQIENRIRALVRYDIAQQLNTGQ